MKYFIALLVAVMFFGANIAFAGELEDAKADQQKVITAYNVNANTQQLMLEGFKVSNIHYQALEKEQASLRELAKKLEVAIKALEAPPVEDAVPAEPSEDGGTAETN